MAWIDGKRGAYRVRWREGGRGAGKCHSDLFEDMRDATAFLRAKEDEMAGRAKGRRGARSQDPITVLVERYRESRAAAGRAREAHLVESSASITAIAEEMKWNRLREVTAAGLDAWRAKRKDGKGTDRPLACMRAFLRWSEAMGLDVDPRARLLLPRARKARAQPPLLTDGQVAQVLVRALTFGPHYATLLEHLALYGCRPIDLCRLQVRDWNPVQMLVTYRDTKNKEDITHPVHLDHGAKLTALCQGRLADDYLFLCRNEPWRVDDGRAGQLSSWYKMNIGVPLEKLTALVHSQIGIYCLKDFAMTRLTAAAGGDRRAVVTMSGHKSLSVVDRYLGTNATTQARLIAAVTMPGAAPAVPSPLPVDPPPLGMGTDSGA